MFKLAIAKTFYTYDRWGNRLSQTSASGGPSPNAAVNSATNQIVGYSYDAAGNLLNHGLGHSFTYDAEGKVLQVNEGSSASYVYDALDHRVRVQTPSVTYEYNFDPFGRKISQWNTANNFGNEARIYWDNKQIAFRAGDGQTYFEHQNYLGTERLRTNYATAGATVDTSLAFGDGLKQNVSIPYSNQDNYGYAGQDYDPESGSSHAQFRQYSSTLGRWMSPDPYDGSYDVTNPQSLNRYSYVLNNPYSLRDPSGLECMWDDGSFDSSDDPDTGSVEQCQDAGGQYSNPSDFGQLGLGDWSGAPDAGLAGIATVSANTTTSYDPSVYNAVYNTLEGVQANSLSLPGIKQYSVIDVFNWAAKGPHTPNGCKSGIVGCLYSHGNWCGAGGSGAPSDSQDGACLVHDFLYAMYHFTPGSNLDGSNPGLQEINQGLCDNSGSMFVNAYFSIGIQLASLNYGNTRSPSCQ